MKDSSPTFLRFSCLCSSVFGFTTGGFPHGYGKVAAAPGITMKHMDQGQHRIVSSCGLIEAERTFSKFPK